MTLNKKHLIIIETLIQHHTSVEKLSHVVEITPRTLTNYVNQINDYFEDISYIMKEHSHYFILIYDEKRFIETLTCLQQRIQSDEEVWSDRLGAVFLYLLKQKQSTIIEIADDLYVSKSVVDNAVAKLKEILEDYPLKIKGTQNVGLRLEGNEFTIRKVLIEQFSKLYQENKISDQIEKHLLELKRTFSLDESSFSRLKLAIQVTLDRLDQGNLLDQELDIDFQIFESEDFKQFKPLTNDIEEIYSIEPAKSNQEVFLLALQLFGRRASLIDEMLNDREQSLLQRIIKQTIEDINYYYTIKIDKSMFSKDIQLHIKYLMNRLLFGVKVNNNLVNDVQERFPFAYELSTVLAENIKKEIEVEVPVSELGFLSLYFSVYLEQLEQQIKEIKSVAIITNGGLSTSKLIKVNLQKVFGTLIEIVFYTEDTFKDKELEKFDLIVSTVWTNRLFNKVIYIEDVLDSQLMKLKIEQFLVYKDVRNRKLFNQSVIADFIEENDFYHIKDSIDYTDVIYFLSEQLVEEGKVNSLFTKNILKREKSKSTASGKLGFPHVGHHQDGIFIKVALIDNNLTDAEEIKIVILLATPEQSGHEAALIRLYEEILALSGNSFALNKLTKDTTYASFTHILNQEMRE